MTKRQIWKQDRRYKSGGYFTAYGKAVILGWSLFVIFTLLFMIASHGLSLLVEIPLVTWLGIRKHNRKKLASGQLLQVEQAEPLQIHPTAMHFQHDVYLAYSPSQGTYKIGYASNIGSRLNTLRTGCPDIQLMRSFSGGRAREKEFHAMFRQRCVVFSSGGKSEWFRLTEQDVRYLLELP